MQIKLRISIGYEPLAKGISKQAVGQWQLFIQDHFSNFMEGSIN